MTAPVSWLASIWRRMNSAIRASMSEAIPTEGGGAPGGTAAAPAPAPSERPDVVLITLDLIGVPQAIRHAVAERAEKEFKLPQANLVMNTSHTHSGPSMRTTPLTDKDKDDPRAKDAWDYTQKLQSDLGDLVVVERIVRRVLEAPLLLARVGIERDRTRGPQVVARAILGIPVRTRVARAPVHRVQLGIESAEAPRRTAAGLPRVVIVLPGLEARLTRIRNRVGAPHLLAGRRVKRGEPTARARVPVEVPPERIHDFADGRAARPAASNTAQRPE
mgnify:CR=1 FL=1